MMQFRPTTILGLFDSSQKHFIIPVYQRAYSWDVKNLDVFLSDLKEQIKGGNNYFYGNILLETVKKDVSYEVIDGQQRLTTLVIFFRAIIDILSKRETKDNLLIDLEEKAKIYLKNRGNIKLRPVEYDMACFETLIIDGGTKYSIATPSQERIKFAKNHFVKELDKIATLDLVKIFDVVEATELTCIELQGKSDSALMFELQNNRGKDLTNMEKIKSYFMYQMYVHSPSEETHSNVEYVSNIFKSLYLLINDINLDEDSILIYHCNAYIKGFNYRTIDDIKEMYNISTNKILWIKDFINELHISFSNIKKMEKSNLSYLKDLRKLVMPAFSYAFIIKGYKYFGDDEKELNKLYHILEIVVFRFKLISSRADFISRINEILQAFEGDLNNLRYHFKKKLNDAWYWGDDRMESILNGQMYDNSVLHYLLWKYENSIQLKGYSIGNVSITNIQTEHISPQNPPNGEALAHGYEVDEENKYDADFLEEYLHCIGNLMLISGSHNASIGNSPFAKKIESYKLTPLLKQQAEIKRFIEGYDEIIWDKDAIADRHEAIVQNFAVKKWSFENVLI